MLDYFHVTTKMEDNPNQNAEDDPNQMEDNLTQKW